MLHRRPKYSFETSVLWLYQESVLSFEDHIGTTRTHFGPWSAPMPGHLRNPSRPRTAPRRTLESGFCVRLARDRQIVCSADSRGWARFPLSTGCGMRRSLGRAREAQAPRAGSVDTTLPANVTAAPSTR